MNTTATWTAKKRGAFRNHYATVNGHALAVFRPTLTAEGWEAVVDGASIAPELFPTIAAAKAAALAAVSA